MGTWDNPDGLHLVFGPAKATANTGGEYRTLEEFRTVEIEIDLTTLTASEVVQSDTTFVPAGYDVAKVQVHVEDAAATGTAIDVGLIRTDRTTELDYNGFLAAFDTATMSAGNLVTLVKGGTQVGALVGSGTPLANIGLITASRTDATAFTAGKIRLKLFLIRV